MSFSSARSCDLSAAYCHVLRRNSRRRLSFNSNFTFDLLLRCSRTHNKILGLTVPAVWFVCDAGYFRPAGTAFVCGIDIHFVLTLIRYIDRCIEVDFTFGLPVYVRCKITFVISRSVIRVSVPTFYCNLSRAKE